MKTAHSLSAVALGAFFLGTPTWAADPAPNEHSAHHPAASAPVAKPQTQPTGPSTVSKDKMAQMDDQMKMMADMHQKMMDAKTPEERSAMMGEQMKMMQDGMAMMNMMGGTGMGGMPNGKSMPGDMTERQQMLEKRMDMMQMMMQMMMDRVSPSMAK